MADGSVRTQSTGTFQTAMRTTQELITNVGTDGSISATTTIPLEGLLPHEASAPPCAIWSPDLRWVSFGAGNEVWLVDTVTEQVRRLADYSAQRPRLAAWHRRARDRRQRDDLRVYSVTTDEIRVRRQRCVPTHLVTGRNDDCRCTLACVGSGEGEHDVTRLWLVDADGTNERALQPTTHEPGVGPVWSSDGRYIAYQRPFTSGEKHEVVLVAVADENDSDASLGTEVVIPPIITGDDRPMEWFPWSVTWSKDGSMLLRERLEQRAPGNREGEGVPQFPSTQRRRGGGGGGGGGAPGGGVGTTGLGESWVPGEAAA